MLSWDASGGACFYASYAVYRGNLPISSYNHVSLDCNVTSSAYTDSNAGGSYYYLVVPNRNVEASYGKSFNGSAWSEIPQSSSPCYPQNINPC